MLDVPRPLLAVPLMHVSDVVVQLLHVLPLQVRVALLLVVVHHLCAQREARVGQEPSNQTSEEQPLTWDDEVVEILHQLLQQLVGLFQTSVPLTEELRLSQSGFQQENPNLPSGRGQFHVCLILDEKEKNKTCELDLTETFKASL